MLRPRLVRVPGGANELQMVPSLDAPAHRLGVIIGSVSGFHAKRGIVEKSPSGLGQRVAVGQRHELVAPFLPQSFDSVQRFHPASASTTYLFTAGLTAIWLMIRRTPDIPLTAAVAALIWCACRTVPDNVTWPLLVWTVRRHGEENPRDASLFVTVFVMRSSFTSCMVEGTRGKVLQVWIRMVLTLVRA